MEFNLEDVEWLKINIDPWGEVKRKWASTLPARKALFQNEEFSIHEYFDQLSCLRIQRGIVLVNKGFIILKTFVQDEDFCKPFSAHF